MRIFTCLTNQTLLKSIVRPIHHILGSFGTMFLVDFFTICWFKILVEWIIFDQPFRKILVDLINNIMDLITILVQYFLSQTFSYNDDQLHIKWILYPKCVIVLKITIRKRWYKNFDRIHKLVDQLNKNLIIP